MEQTAEFIKERKYLMNVSVATLAFYRDTFISVSKHGDLSEEGLKRWVVGSREAGNSPRSINTRITGINAYLKWKGEKYRVSRLKCANRVLPIYTREQLDRLLKWKPETPNEKRLQLLILLILDTGVRIAEATGILWEDIDFDNLIIKVRGKGTKERLVPFSSELRKRLWVHAKTGCNPTEHVLESRDGKLVEAVEVSFGAWILHKITRFSKKILFPPAGIALFKKSQNTSTPSKKTKFSDLTAIRMGMVGLFKKFTKRSMTPKHLN